MMQVLSSEEAHAERKSLYEMELTISAPTRRDINRARKWLDEWVADAPQHEREAMRVLIQAHLNRFYSGEKPISPTDGVSDG